MNRRGEEGRRVWNINVKGSAAKKNFEAILHTV